MAALQKVGILILAAGPSSRLGSPKQLLSYQDKTLLNHTIDAAKTAQDGIVVVILGGNHELIKDHIDEKEIMITYNSQWEGGMSSSIRAGLYDLVREHKDLDAVILAVCDQPFITAELFDALVLEANTSGKSIVASSYGDTLGTPVLFAEKYFAELSRLKGKQGAKAMVAKYDDEVAVVPFDKGHIDIDTPEDYTRLINT
jgi:molybdenum cofactor cytidylyltransferase